jgi:hypothetical protein
MLVQRAAVSLFQYIPARYQPGERMIDFILHQVLFDVLAVSHLIYYY